MARMESSSWLNVGTMPLFTKKVNQMADIAQLGVEVRSNGVEKTTGDLNRLSGAAARAEAATEGLSYANRGATGAASAAAKAFAAEGAAASSASKQIEMMNLAANQNRVGGKANVANIAAQFQDIAVTAAMSMNPMQIALQQGTQLVGVLGSMERPLAGLASAFMSLLSPLSLVTIGLVALAASGLQMVDWPKLAAWALRELADILEMIAPYAVAAAAAIALLYAPAIIGGIISLIAWLGRLVVQLGIVAAAFIAANPVVAFIAGLTLAVAAANIFRDELEQIFGFDIVKAAKDGVNAVIGAFVGGYEALKAVWEKLPAALGDIVYSTAQKVIDGIESMVQKAIDGLNNLTNKYALWTASIGKPLSPETYNSMIIGPVNFGDVDNPYSGSAAGVRDAAQKAYNNAQGTDYVGKAYEYIGDRASQAADKLRSLAKGITDVDSKSKKKGGKSDLEKYDDIVNGAERHIASLEAERKAIGLTEEAAAAMRYEQDLLNQAQQRNIDLTPTQRDNLSALAGVMASVEAGVRKAQEALDFAKNATKGFLSDLRSGLANGEGIWKSFGNAAMGVIEKVADKLETDLVDALFSVNSAAGGGSGGGLLSSLFGGLFSSQWKIASSGGIGLYADGTSSARTGLAVVGERGPELVRFRGGEQVVPNHQLRSANQNSPSSNGAQHVEVTSDVRVSVDNNGNLKAFVERTSARTSGDMITQFSREALPGRVNEISQDPRAVG